MWNTDFATIRCLGCYIWDLEKLAALELLNHRQWQNPLPSDVALSQCNLWFMWESLQSQDDLEANDCGRINQFPES